MTQVTNEIPHNCKTCRWWFQESICVFHTGMKGSHKARISFGGTAPLRTIATFGCIEWRANEVTMIDARQKLEETKQAIEVLRSHKIEVPAEAFEMAELFGRLVNAEELIEQINEIVNEKNDTNYEDMSAIARIRGAIRTWKGNQ